MLVRTQCQASAGCKKPLARNYEFAKLLRLTTASLGFHRMMMPALYARAHLSEAVASTKACFGLCLPARDVHRWIWLNPARFSHIELVGALGRLPRELDARCERRPRGPAARAARTVRAIFA